MGVPLMAEGKVTGAFAIQNYYDSKTYTTRDLDMLEFVSNQISLSLQRKKAMQELKAALLKAEENDRLKTAFLHNISHEIRTPMNAIIGFSSFLNDPAIKPAEMHEYTEIICNASQQLLSIIEDIINISTVEVGQEILMPKETNLNKLLNNLYKQFQTKIQNSGIKLQLKTTLPDEYIQVVTDETKFLQVITNLLNNACKFTKKGQVFFGYELKGDNLEFYVEDTGIGINSAMHEAIFERFRQADGSIAREFGGTGLGLSISKAYVKLLGGEIWLDSTVGKGSKFYFTIPYKPVDIAYKQDPQRPNVEMMDPEKQKIVLIAEDENFNFILLNELFKGMNVKIIWAKNGWEVLNACNENNVIDLVLMDMKMPVMDGFEATQILRGAFPNIPIVAQTAYATEKELQRVHECGCNDVITKPIDINLFKSIINKYLAVDEPVGNFNTVSAGSIIRNTP
jgi:signal transduction histidine kinase/CheY-like chemotaxis protein